ncbi:unnamed protein product [Aureobasidium vineae]|uniref:Uncharacterized protein n=1 Tax=Aureobasidium vineae TaxID=2773715 RepID=A0A9N8P963_9PEZI|nr:unnamed protein product [Aureobasidium vineae]
MSAKSILEADGKAILNYHLTRAPVIKPTPLPAAANHNPHAKLCSLYFAEGASPKDVLDEAEVKYPGCTSLAPSSSQSPISSSSDEARAAFGPEQDLG